MLLDLLQDLAGQDHHRGGAVTHFCILRARNVDEDPGGGVDDVEELALESGTVAVSRGCWLFVLAKRTFMTVAPSLVMVCLPLASTINKSPP